MIAVVTGLFLIWHGLIHLLFLAPVPPGSKNDKEWPFKFEDSWLLTPLGLNNMQARRFGTVLAVITAAAFVIGGVSRMGVFGGWAIPVSISAVCGLLLLGIYWRPWLSLGVLLNLGILILAVM
jgi:hypothetical protein